ncbi:MAG: ABC transporter ATP-binding protein [Stellaceae bacterium]
MAGADDLLRLSRISKRFGAVVVASELDFAVERGTAVGIIGPNGAGKTTLFGMITGTVQPDSGEVTFAGENITRLSPARRCHLGVARSFQIPQPFTGMTVFENTMVAASFGPRLAERAAQIHCMAILERCGLAPKANRLAGALTLLDRKRLELARALAANPKLLLLDEVVGGLTEHECAVVIDLIRTVREAGVTIVWVEHVVHALIAVVDRLAVLHGGRFIADGAPRTVIESPNVRQIYLGIAADAI